MILNKIVFLELKGIDIYDRLIANIYFDGINLNEYLIEKIMHIDMKEDGKIRNY